MNIEPGRCPKCDALLVVTERVMMAVKRGVNELGGRPVPWVMCLSCDFEAMGMVAR